MATYYEILEVNQNASQEEIKRAYKKLSLKWHPDRFGQPNHLAQSREQAEAQMKEINGANDVLSDERKRREYDDLRRTSSASSSSAHYDPTDYSFRDTHQRHTHYGSHTHWDTEWGTEWDTENEPSEKLIELIFYALLIISVVCYQLLVKLTKWLKKRKQNQVETYNQRKIREWKEAKRRSRERERERERWLV